MADAGVCKMLVVKVNGEVIVELLMTTLSEEAAPEVAEAIYQFNIQLFPLSKRRSKESA